MNILFLLVPVAIVLAAAGVAGFLWAVRSGQFDDVQTPALRVLIEDDAPVQRRPNAPENKAP